MVPHVTDMSAMQFTPTGLLANPHVQSLLNSSALRKVLIHRRARQLRNSGKKWILDGGNGVRLLGYYNPQPDQSARGLVILLHGWEGSSDSNYILSTAKRLYDSGYDIFRLNFRDHGDSHDLNTEIFHSCRLDEVVNAVADICRKIDAPCVFLAGFSLGGNFALRVGLRALAENLALTKIVAICPVISPSHVLDALENGPTIYHRYFVKKWRRSLRIKQRCFPGHYDYSEWFRIKGLRAQTKFLVERYTDYQRVEDYLDGYALYGDRLSQMEIPTTIISARDDPMIPAADFEGLETSAAIKRIVTENGGHCSFMQDWRLNSWIDEFIEAEINYRGSGAGRGN